MLDENETVVIEMFPDARLRLYGQITGQMEKLGYNPADYKALNLSFELPADWPVGEDTELTIAQLVVVALKLNMRITISDLHIVPCKGPGEEKQNDSREGG